MGIAYSNFALAMAHFFAFLLAMSFACLVGCDRSTDETELLRSTLIDIEKHQSVNVIVLRSGLSSEARQAASKLRKTVDESRVVPDTGYKLPEHFLILVDINVSGPIAHVITHMGPIPKSRPNVGMLACGTRRDTTYQRQADGIWRQGDTETVVC